MSEPDNTAPPPAEPPKKEPPKKEPPKDKAAPLRVVNADELFFQGEREICIALDGERYRLRITRRNRLILQK